MLCLVITQHFEGYTLFLCKQHVTELFLLEPKYKIKFLEEMSIVAQAVALAFKAEKMNVELLGNGDAHVHWHLFPRVKGDLEAMATMEMVLFGGIPWKKMYDNSNRPSSKKLAEMKEKLQIELDKLEPKMVILFSALKINFL